MPLILNNDDVDRTLSLDACLETLEHAYLELAAGRAVNRPTTQTYLPHEVEGGSYSFKSVEGGVASLGVMALRLTSDIVRRVSVDGAPRLNKVPLAGGRFVGLVLVFSVETGELLAIMPDGRLQQARVAATSAIAMQRLARPDSRVLALIGSGDQARAHLRALLFAGRFDEVRVFSPRTERREAFAREMTEACGIAVGAVATVEAAVAGSDVVCTATNSWQPIITAEHLVPGMHYNAIREFELDESVFTRSDVVVIHTRFGGSHHYQPPGQVGDLPGVRREKARNWDEYPEIGHLLSGQAPGRTNSSDITFFLNNIGTGVQFAAVAAVVLRRARALGLGHDAPADWFLQDIKP